MRFSNLLMAHESPAHGVYALRLFNQDRLCLTALACKFLLLPKLDCAPWAPALHQQRARKEHEHLASAPVHRRGSETRRYASALPNPIYERGEPLTALTTLAGCSLFLLEGVSTCLAVCSEPDLRGKPRPTKASRNMLLTLMTIIMIRNGNEVDGGNVDVDFGDNGS